MSDLSDRLRTEGLEPGSWSNGPRDRYGAHEHGYDKVLVCERGSIRFGVPEAGGVVELATGDRLELPAGTAHDALVCGQGVNCLEAHLTYGSIEALRLRRAGDW
jgi:uncharacterized protein YjlB